jgi:ATP phosphoribosyltransferase
MPKYDRITPEGTRDMLFEECAVQGGIVQGLRAIFEGRGYREVKTPGFEFYDVFSSKADYYPQESMYKFSDVRGRLIAVRPDSTIPIARLTATKLRGHDLPIRLYYAQRVYRQQQELRGRSGEIMQMGVELIGDASFESDIEVLLMAAESLREASGGAFRIEIGHVGFYKLLMEKLSAAPDDRALIHRYVAAKNYAALDDVLDRYPAGCAADMIRRLPRLFGGTCALRDAAEWIKGFGETQKVCAASDEWHWDGVGASLDSDSAVAGPGGAGSGAGPVGDAEGMDSDGCGIDQAFLVMIEHLERIFAVLDAQGLSDHIMIDFGLVNQAEYYSSLVFRGYLERTGAPVLSGGRYDKLFADFGEDLPATGFGMNIDLLTAAALRRKNTAGRLYGVESAFGQADGAQGEGLPYGTGSACDHAAGTPNEDLPYGIRPACDGAAAPEMAGGFVSPFEAKENLCVAEETSGGLSADAALYGRKLRIALTKGRLEKRFISLMESAGYDCGNLHDKGRKLLLTIPGTEIEIFLAKAPDVITYVEHGVCDIGIVGKDTILEQGGTYYEIMDLEIGKCRFALATPVGQDFFGGFGTKVVATKYPNVAGRFFERKGMDVEIIKIEGSVELAPILSLADGIVDIVETGVTLRENGLEITEEIRSVSARLIVNVTGMKLKKAAVDEFADRIAAVKGKEQG